MITDDIFVITILRFPRLTSVVAFPDLQNPYLITPKAIAAVHWLFVFILWRVVCSQCFTSGANSYCLSGLNITDHNAVIISQYTIDGTINGCDYFKSYEGEFLSWNAYHDRWMITTTPGNSSGYAYCLEVRLDDCGNGHWHYYDGSTFSLNPKLSIVPCSYNNAACLTSYDKKTSMR